MSRKSREEFYEESRRALTRLLGSFGSFAAMAAIPAGYPLLPQPDEGDAELRRTVRRLRRREIDPADPEITHDELADFYERRIAARAVLNAAVRDNLEARELAAALYRHDVMARDRAALYAARHHPDADDPDSDAARLVREINRARRAFEGRSRRRG
jgi:hypothetical protein